MMISNTFFSIDVVLKNRNILVLLKRFFDQNFLVDEPGAGEAYGV